MLEERPALTIRRGIERPPIRSIEALRGVPTAFIVDAMEGRGTLAYDIEPLAERATKGDHLVGAAPHLPLRSRRQPGTVRGADGHSDR